MEKIKPYYCPIPGPNGGPNEESRSSFLTGTQLQEYLTPRENHDLFTGSTEEYMDHFHEVSTTKYPGRLIDLFGGHHYWDDRHYAVLKDIDPSLVSPTEYEKFMCRFAFFFAGYYNIAEFVAPFTLDKERCKNMSKIQACKAKIPYLFDCPNEQWKYIFTDVSVVYGGNRKWITGLTDLVHQPCHEDHDCLQGEGKGDLLPPEVRTLPLLPGSFICPIVQPRTIYFGHPKCEWEIRKGDCLYFSGISPHGGITYKDYCGSMRPAVHGHLDLKSLKRSNDVLGIDNPPAYETPEHKYQQNALTVQQEEEVGQQEEETEEEEEQYTREQVMRMNAQQLKEIYKKNSWKNYKNKQQARKTILAYSKIIKDDF